MGGHKTYYVLMNTLKVYCIQEILSEMAVGPGGTFTYDIGEAKRGGGGYIGTGVDSLGR